MTSIAPSTESLILGTKTIINSPAIIKHMIHCGDKIICGMYGDSIQIYDIQTRKFTHKFKATSHSDGICYSPFENIIICGDLRMRIFDINTRNLLKTLKINSPYGLNGVRSITITDSPISGDKIIISSTDEIISIHDLNTYELVGRLDNTKAYLKHTLIIRPVHPGSNYLLAIFDDCPYREYKVDNIYFKSKSDIDIIDIADNKCIKTLKGHNNRILNVLASSNGRFLVSCSWDTTIKIWDTTSWECIKTLQCNTSYIKIFISQDDKLLISLVNGKIMIWNISTGHCIKTILDQDIEDQDIESMGHVIIIDNMIVYSTSKKQIKFIPFIFTG